MSVDLWVAALLGLGIFLSALFGLIVHAAVETLSEREAGPK